MMEVEYIETILSLPPFYTDPPPPCGLEQTRFLGCYICTKGISLETIGKREGQRPQEPPRSPWSLCWPPGLSFVSLLSQFSNIVRKTEPLKYHCEWRNALWVNLSAGLLMPQLTPAPSETFILSFSYPGTIFSHRVHTWVHGTCVLPGLPMTFNPKEMWKGVNGVILPIAKVLEPINTCVHSYEVFPRLLRRFCMLSKYVLLKYTSMFWFHLFFCCCCWS